MGVPFSSVPFSSFSVRPLFSPLFMPFSQPYQPGGGGLHSFRSECFTLARLPAIENLSRFLAPFVKEARLEGRYYVSARRWQAS